MAVNTNVYGLPEQWTNAFFQQVQITTKNKLASFGTNAKTLSEGVTAAKLSYDSPIDKSLSYCGLGTESAMSHVVYCGLHDNAFKAYDSTDREVTNFAFFEKQTSTTYIADDFIRLNELNRVDWSENINPEWNFTKDLIPYTVINPHNILLYVSLSVSNGDGAYQYTSLNYFRNNHTQQNWTRIARVKLTPYFGNNYDNVAWSSSAGYSPTPEGHSMHLGLLDEYVVTTKDKSFYMYENPNFEWVPFGFVGANGIGSLTDTNLVYMCYIPESAKSHIKYDNVHREFYIEYYDDIVEDILKTVACFGLYFCTTTADLGNLTNEYTYIGLIDSDGIGRGRYLKGAETVNAPQAQADYTDMHNTGYTPSADETKYRNDTQFYAGYGTSSFTKFYALTEAQVNTLSQELYRIANDVPAATPITEYNMKVFLTNNPIDCIISLKKFPVLNIPLATSDATIYLGSKATSITGKILATPTWVYYFNFRNSANTSCRPIFGDNFLDYEPYTKCKIVIPFCGTVDIPVSYIYQYDDLQIALVMDFITGACTAYILVNGITIDSITGSCAIDLPVSGIQSATLDSQIHSVANAREKQQTALNTGLIAGAVSIGVGLATGNLPIAIGGGAAIIGSFMHATDTGKQINYELSHMDTPVKQVSAASGQIAHTYDMRCKMIITRPEISPEYSAEDYASTIGFACLENGKVQDFQGFTVANIDLNNIEATAYEKQMISNAFAQGVYL